MLTTESPDRALFAGRSFWRRVLKANSVARTVFTIAFVLMTDGLLFFVATFHPSHANTFQILRMLGPALLTGTGLGFFIVRSTPLTPEYA